VFGDVISPGAGSTAPTSPDMVASPDLSASTGSKDGVPGTPTSEKDVSPLGSPIVENAGQAQFRRHHRRQSSLGTTRTSPSTRRRSLENTISMIREAMSKNDESMGELELFLLEPRCVARLMDCSTLSRGTRRKSSRKRISSIPFFPSQLDLCWIRCSISTCQSHSCALKRLSLSLSLRFSFPPLPQNPSPSFLANPVISFTLIFPLSRSLLVCNTHVSPFSFTILF